MGKTITRSQTKKALVQAGTPIYDSVVADLGFDPALEIEYPKHAAASPVAVAEKATRRRKARAAALAS